MRYVVCDTPKCALVQGCLQQEGSDLHEFIRNKPKRDVIGKIEFDFFGRLFLNKKLDT